MAKSPVAPSSKAPYSRAPFSRAPESVAPVSRFPGASGSKSPSRKAPEPLESVSRQLRWVAALLVLLLVAVGALIHIGQQHTQLSLTRQSAIADMRLMAQGIGRAAVLAVAGQAPGFAQLREAKESFPQQLASLGEPEERFQGLNNAWATVAKDITTLQSQEKPLLAMGRVASVFDGQGAPLVDLSEQLLMMQKKTGGHPREIEATAQVVGLAARITRNAGLLLTSDPVRPELAVQLDQDGAAMAKLVDALKNGSDNPRYGPISQPDQRTQVLMLDKAFVEFQVAATSLLSNVQMLKEARAAGGRLQKGADSLAAQTLNLARELQATDAEHQPYETWALALTVLALLTALGLLALYRKDVQLRQDAIQAQRHGLEKANKQNQDAILRLMNELGNLANGDLTVKATVNEDITGAIADSVNYTVEEFRGTVQRINQASERVADASAGARDISAQLLEAAKEQSTQIHQAGVSALEMAQSMNHVSADANRSAQVARKSLEVARHGAQAVQDSMKGMNSIRDQIQETAKRIKRLGDSSLEIGEIVEMISDITEQTHVLALNAAIQAASAGEAGRGFTVVAEEVQRLAERSGDATRQIADIVKTIQADTRNAVAAMERSTLDVVEGTKLSDAAGQALAEVGEVSSQMAGLIDSISLATQKQSNTATQVAKRMKDILKITEQTTGGTQQTTQAVAELDKLVAELKGSVAGFKVN